MRRTDSAPARSHAAKGSPRRLPTAFSVARRADGGFRLVGRSGWLVEASPAKEGLAVTGAGTGAGWTLTREPCHAGGGFVLRVGADSDAREIGRSSRIAGAEQHRTILLEDGRLFRIAGWVTDEGAGVDLRGWETRAAFYSARASRDGFRVTSGPAGRSLRSGTDLLVVFAAEVLDDVGPAGIA